MSCSEAILAAAKKDGLSFNKEEAQEIIDVLEGRLQKRAENSLAEEYTDLAKLAKNIARQTKTNAVIEKRNRILNAKAYIDIMTVIRKNPDNPSEALSSVMVGSAQLGNFKSVDARQHALNTHYQGTLLAAINDAGLEKFFKSKDAEELIYRAMFAKEQDANGNFVDFDVNQAGGAEAKKVADIIKAHQKVRLDRKNLHGTVIAELENYAVRQGHDPILLRKGAKTADELEVSKKEWVDYMLEPNRLSRKTFDNKPSFTTIDGKKVPYTDEMFLSDMWGNLVTGQHQKLDPNTNSADPVGAFKGPSNMAKKLSQSRTIHFENGTAAYEYSKKYTRMSLVDAVISGIDHDAQSIGLMEVFGTNPTAMFDRVLNDVRSGNAGDVLVLDSVKDFNLRNQFKEIDGSSKARGSSRPILFGADFAGLASGWRMIQSMAKLGAATISSFGDIATNATFINSNTDRGIFGSYAKSLGFVFSRFKGKDQKRLAYLLGVGIEGAMGSTHARFGSNDSLPGTIGKAQQHYFRLNLMTFWNDDQKSGVAKLLAADLATYKGNQFSELNVRTRNSLQRYDINEAEWDVLRQMDMTAADGRAYMFAGGVDNIPANVIEAAALAKTNAGRKRPVKTATKASIDKYKNDLMAKYSMYITDSAETAIPTPGAKERAYMNVGTERGTVLGEAIRAFMQFKAFPVTYVTKAAQRQRYARIEEGKSGLFGVAQMMVGTTMMGYLSVTMKDIMKGKSPEEVFGDEYGLNPKLLTRAIVQGGGLGIYGDVLFGEHQKFGRGLLQTMSGPTFGSIEQIDKIYGSVKSGDPDAILKNSVQFAKSNIPGINLFYTKTALDYLFIHGMMEHVNPGYLRRMERRMKKDTDQTFYFPPSQTAVRF